MKLYQVIVFENAHAGLMLEPEMHSYEVFQHRDNAVAFIPTAIAHFREANELDENVDVDAIIEELELMDAEATWDAVGGRPVNPDVSQSAAMLDDKTQQLVNDVMEVSEAFDCYHSRDPHWDDWEY